MKKVGSCIYCHWTNTVYLSSVAFHDALDILEWSNTWDYVKWDTKTDTFTFTWCDDFNGKNEPVVRRQFRVDGCVGNALPVSKTNPPIIHGKHLFVREDYAGFDVDEARARWNSYQGADWLDKSRMGFLKWWTENAIPRIGE